MKIKEITKARKRLSGNLQPPKGKRPVRKRMPTIKEEQMDKFKIVCPECEEKFSLTKRQIIKRYPGSTYFNEISIADYNDHTKIECPNCGYRETDKED